MMEKYRNHSNINGYFEERRKQQANYWMHESIAESLRYQFYHHPEMEAQIKAFEARVNKGEISSFFAAESLLNLFRSGKQS